MTGAVSTQPLESVVRRAIGVALAVIGVLASTACSGGPASDDGTQEIRIGYIAGGAGAAPDVIAEQKGFFAKHGLTVEQVNSNSGPGLVNLAIADGVDVTWAPTSNALAAADRVQIVARNVRNSGFTMIQRGGADGAVAGQPFPANLRGRNDLRIGVSVKGSYAQVLADQILAAAGNRPGSATMVGVGVDTTALGALRSDQVDMAITSAVPTAKAVAEGDAAKVVSTREIPSLAALPEGVYVTERDADADELARVKKYLEAIQEALAWAKDPANSEELGEIITSYFKVQGPAADVVKQMYSPTGGNQIGEFGLELRQEDFDEMNALLVRAGMLPAPVPFVSATNLLVNPGS